MKDNLIALFWFGISCLTVYLFIVLLYNLYYNFSNTAPYVFGVILFVATGIGIYNKATKNKFIDISDKDVSDFKDLIKLALWVIIGLPLLLLIMFLVQGYLYYS